MKETHDEVRNKSVICYQIEHNKLRGERRTGRVM